MNRLEQVKALGLTKDEARELGFTFAWCLPKAQNYRDYGSAWHWNAKYLCFEQKYCGEHVLSWLAPLSIIPAMVQRDREVTKTAEMLGNSMAAYKNKLLAEVYKEPR